MVLETGEAALDGFVSHWATAGKFRRWRTTKVIISNFFITYTSRGATKSLNTEAHLYHLGRRIELIDRDWLKTGRYYTGFNPKYQRYSLQEEYILRIDGSGEKTNGAYHLTIEPA